jgi:hypothetical protein
MRCIAPPQQKVVRNPGYRTESTNASVEIYNNPPLHNHRETTLKWQSKGEFVVYSQATINRKPTRPKTIDRKSRLCHKGT